MRLNYRLTLDTLYVNAHGDEYRRLRPRYEGLYIWDLDGTLSDGRHRLHLLPAPEYAHITQSWDEFNMASIADLPLTDNIRLCNQLYKDGYQILILTGRSAVSREVTEKWLKLHNVSYDALLMRDIEDHRKDTEFKGQILNELLVQYPGRINAAFDDLEHVCKFIRGLGITCYQVAHYDTPKLHEQERKDA